MPDGSPVDERKLVFFSAPNKGLKFTLDAFRAKLPAPKRYLSLARLIRAARLFENPGLSVARVANHLDYSSPQSFGRHVRTVMRMSPVKFRATYDGQGMLQLFRRELILPHIDVLSNFRPCCCQ